MSLLVVYLNLLFATLFQLGVVNYHSFYLRVDQISGGSRSIG
jgi:hypothetical protein